MSQVIGVRAAGEALAVGVVEANRVVGPIRRYPQEGRRSDSLLETPAEFFGEANSARERWLRWSSIRRQVAPLCWVDWRRGCWKHLRANRFFRR